ncbi:MAG: hypothetical protein H6858_02795 [Rhodospirillales bacterium]|nr:hypothetical protein [Alphaproteobacteria bacterium]MCB9976511.1 hypothetical protein [Rhodospirillales bacterium]
MNMVELIAEFILPVLFPLFVFGIVISKIFRFKDSIVRLMDEARKNPDLYKKDPEAMRELLLKLQQSKGGRSVPVRQSSSQKSSSRSSSVPLSSGARGSRLVQSGRDLRTTTPTKRSSPLRGTARMTQIRQEHKIKTTVAVFFLLGGVSLLFSTYYYGFVPEMFLTGAVLMGAGLFLLKSGVERV